MGDRDSGSARVSPAFRTTLRRELDVWVNEGVVDSDQSAAISKRYRLNGETQKSGGMVVQALYLIGACLIGGGAISFVASRWEEIPVPMRMALLFSTLFAFEVAGFYLWKVSGTRKKLGEALVVLGRAGLWRQCRTDRADVQSAWRPVRGIRDLGARYGGHRVCDDERALHVTDVCHELCLVRWSYRGEPAFILLVSSRDRGGGSSVSEALQQFGVRRYYPDGRGGNSDLRGLRQRRSVAGPFWPFR